MQAARIIGVGLTAALLLSGCGLRDTKQDMNFSNFLSPDPPPPVIRQPVLPEMLKACRGHVLVPGLGMKFVPRGTNPPDTGQFMREENLSAPYRIIPPGARVSPERSPQRLNVELDGYGRIVGLYCG